MERLRFDKGNIITVLIAILFLVSIQSMDLDEKENNDVYLSDKYVSKLKIGTIYDYSLEEGIYQSLAIDNNSVLIIRDSETQFVLNLNSQSVDRNYDHSHLGPSYKYNGKYYYVYGMDIEVRDSDNQVETIKKLFTHKVNSLVYYDELAIVSLNRGQGIYAVELETLEVKWSITDSDRIDAGIELTLVDDVLYYFHDGTMYGLNPDTGEVNKELSGEFYQPYIFENDYVFTAGDRLKKVNLQTGDFIASEKTSCYSMIKDNSSLYVISLIDEKQLKRYEKNTLELQWSLNIYDSVGWELIQMDNYVGIVNSNSQVALVNKQTGEVEWVEEFQIGDSVYGYKNYLVIISESGRIQYFDTAAPQN